MIPYIVDIGSGVIPEITFLRHAKQCWDCSTNEVQFRYGTGASDRPRARNDSSNTSNTNEHTSSTEDSTDAELTAKDIEQVTKEIYIERAQRPPVSTSDLEQVHWPSKKSDTKKISLLGRRKFVHIRSLDRRKADSSQGLAPSLEPRDEEDTKLGESLAQRLEQCDESERIQLGEIPVTQASPETGEAGQQEERDT